MIEKIEKEIYPHQDLIITKEELKKILKNHKEKIRVIIELISKDKKQNKKKLLAEILNYEKMQLIDSEIKRKDAYED